MESAKLRTLCALAPVCLRALPIIIINNNNNDNNNNSNINNNNNNNNNNISIQRWLHNYVYWKIDINSLS